MSSFSLIAKKFVVPAIITVLGIVMVLIGLINNQNTIYLVASANVLIGGIMAILFSAGIMKKGAIVAISGFCILVSIVLIGYTYVSVTGTIEHQKAYELNKIEIEQNLKDIREAEKNYKNTYGVYTDDWSELEKFIKTGEITQIDRGSVPVPSRPLTSEEIKLIYNDNRAADVDMTELEAWIISKNMNPVPEDVEGFKRDTNMVPFYSNVFGKRSYMDTREQLGLGPLVVENLKYIPGTEDDLVKWSIETVDSLAGTGEAAIRVEGTGPIGPLEGGLLPTYYFGETSSPKLSGSWEK